METTTQEDTMTETEQLDTMTDRELAAYWNVMQFPGFVLSDGKIERHLGIVDTLLAVRDIPHERGALTRPA